MTVAIQAGVKVEGLRQLQSAIRRVDRSLGPEIRKAGNRVAQPVIRDARSRASTRMERAAAATLRGGSTQRGAAIRLGFARVPFSLGAEFGAGRDRTRRRSSGTYVGFRQFRPWRGAGRQAGYFLYPSVRANAPKVTRIYLTELEKLLNRNGL